MGTNDFITLAVKFRMETVDQKQVLFKEGDPGDYFIALVKGSLLLGKDSKVVTAPATVAIDDVLHGRNFTDTAISAERSSIIRLSKGDLSEFVKLCPTQAIAVMKRLAGVEERVTVQAVEAVQGDYTAERKLEIAKSALGIPPQQKVYGDVLDIPSVAKHLHATEYSCPICGTKFNEKSILYSLLRTVSTEFDLRIKFKDFDPMWYSILVCPTCKYANLEKDYMDVGRNEGAKISQKLKEGGVADIDKIYGDKRTVDDVIIAYYIALSCIEELNDNEVTKAKLWLNIVWLYEDVQDTEMAKFASTKALEHYNHIYQFTRKLETPEAEQQIFMIMAELNLRLGEKTQAMQLLSQAFKSESSNRVYKEKCRRKFEDLKYEDK